LGSCVRGTAIIAAESSKGNVAAFASGSDSTSGGLWRQAAGWVSAQLLKTNDDLVETKQPKNQG
jgi:hypothetical protein